MTTAPCRWAASSRIFIPMVSINEHLDVADDRFIVDRESDPVEQLLDNENELDAAKAARLLWDQLSPRERGTH